jgi:hypothetical protein
LTRSGLEAANKDKNRMDNPNTTTEKDAKAAIFQLPQVCLTKDPVKTLPEVAGGIFMGHV